MPDRPYLEEDSVIACADLVKRTGAEHFQIGYLHDDVPVAEAGWYAEARYRGGRIIAQDHAGPSEAADALARRILIGGTCQGCHRVITLISAKRGQCRWRRMADRWVNGCGR